MPAYTADQIAAEIDWVDGMSYAPSLNTSGQLSQEIWSLGGLAIRAVQYTYNASGQLATQTKIIYDADGATVISKYVATYTYSMIGGQLLASWSCARVV